MLISPPFLPPRGDMNSEQWFAKAMACGVPGDGAYPVSANLDWHGGVHLTAPMNGATPEPVRAIADGTVIFVREPSDIIDPEHPLCYGGGRTSDGVVVIRHDTEIGANAQGRPTTLRLYSIYHHLCSIRPSIKQTRPIRRKHEIGQAGYVYGKPNQIHFEIRCDNENLQKLVGRVSGDLQLNTDGRTDAIFGEIYLILPPNTEIYSQCPLLNTPNARIMSESHPTRATVLQPTARLNQTIIVGIRYAGGNGESGHQGDAFLSSYSLDGNQIGTTISEPEAEYKLYQSCTAISRSYPTTQQPSPSALLELLRFGRIIGPDALMPTDTPHWREISHPNGRGWVNLNATNVRKFSDADFPQWKGWELIADDAKNDARCDSPTLISWLNPRNNREVDPINCASSLSQASVNQKFQKTICKIPCEWNRSTLDARWDWLKTKDRLNPFPMSHADYERYKNHISALCFDSRELFEAQWTLSPISFIALFNPVTWLDEATFKDLYPQASKEQLTQYRIEINKTMRKYGIQGAVRASHFLGQAAVESGQLAWMSELHNGDAQDYFRKYEKAKNFNGWLGNIQWNDGANFRGRGLKQLTGRSNYASYWVYRGWIQQDSFSTNWWRNLGWWGLSGNTLPRNQTDTPPIRNNTQINTLISSMRPPDIENPDLINSNAYNCIDTAGWFWAKNNLLSHADSNDTAEMTRKIRGDNSETGRTRPWPAAAHYPERRDHTNRLIGILGETS